MERQALLSRRILSLSWMDVNKFLKNIIIVFEKSIFITESFKIESCTSQYLKVFSRLVSVNPRSYWD